MTDYTGTIQLGKGFGYSKSHYEKLRNEGHVNAGRLSICVEAEENPEKMFNRIKMCIEKRNRYDEWIIDVLYSGLCELLFYKLVKKVSKDYLNELINKYGKIQIK